MNRVALELARDLHQPSLAAGYSLPVVRVLANIRLKQQQGWTITRKAIVDTGASVSLIPRSVWLDADIAAITPVRTAGVVNRPECTVEATLAKVECVVLHGQDHIGPLSIHALLAESDRVPLLLGVSGILDRVRLLVDISADRAILEAP